MGGKAVLTKPRGARRFCAIAAIFILGVGAGCNGTPPRTHSTNTHYENVAAPGDAKGTTQSPMIPIPREQRPALTSPRPNSSDRTIQPAGKRPKPESSRRKSPYQRPSKWRERLKAKYA